MIEVSGLTKRYGQNTAVNNISFQVGDGEIVGFLGPNGAGKSTTMNILTGYLSATEGVCKINGIDILENPEGAKKSVGYLPEMPPLYMDMKVGEYLDFVYDLKKCKKPREEHINEICRLVQIDGVYNRLIKNLSKGYKQRVGLAQALIGDPEVLILDEPTVGLDPNQIIEIRSLIKSLGKKHTVILSSHILPEVQAVCDRVIVISCGQIVADDTTAHLTKAMTNDNRYFAVIDGPVQEVVEKLHGIPEMKTVKLSRKRDGSVCEYILESKENSDICRPLFALLAGKNWPLLGLQKKELTLEEIFYRLTSGSPVDSILPKKEADASLHAETAVKEKNESDLSKNDGGEEK